MKEIALTLQSQWISQKNLILWLSDPTREELKSKRLSSLELMPSILSYMRELTLAKDPLILFSNE